MLDHPEGSGTKAQAAWLGHPGLRRPQPHCTDCPFLELQAGKKGGGENRETKSVNGIFEESSEGKKSENVSGRESGSEWLSLHLRRPCIPDNLSEEQQWKLMSSLALIQAFATSS